MKNSSKSYPPVPLENAQRVILRIAKDHNLDFATSERIFNNTLAFLSLSASFPGERFAPSIEVDKGWHTFLLYTRAYRSFCESLGVPFIDHEPSDGSTKPNKGGAMQTVRFMQEAGIVYDAELWPMVAVGDCQADPCNCTGEGGSVKAKGMLATAACEIEACNCRNVTNN